MWWWQQTWSILTLKNKWPWNSASVLRIRSLHVLLLQLLARPSWVKLMIKVLYLISVSYLLIFWELKYCSFEWISYSSDAPFSVKQIIPEICKFFNKSFYNVMVLYELTSPFRFYFVLLVSPCINVRELKLKSHLQALISQVWILPLAFHPARISSEILIVWILGGLSLEWGCLWYRQSQSFHSSISTILDACNSALLPTHLLHALAIWSHDLPACLQAAEVKIFFFPKAISFLKK